MTTSSQTPPPSNEQPSPAKARVSAGIMLASVGTLLTIAVGGSQLVINGMQIREKVAAKPATSTPVAHGDLTPGTGRAPRGDVDPAAVDESAKLPALDNNVGLLGGEAPADNVFAPPGKWLDYPLAAGQTLPRPVATPVHRLFVALEQGIRNAGDYTYIVYLPDTDAVRQMKKPPKDGTAIALPDGDSGTTLSVHLTQDLWERIQHAEGQHVVLIGCVCVAAECQAPILDWEMVRKVLDDKSVQTTSIGWSGVAKNEAVTLVRDSGEACTMPGPLILALVTPEGA